MRPDWQAESRAVRNVAEAIERTVAVQPPATGASEYALWRGCAAQGVSRAVFESALETLVTRQVVRRADGRVYFAERGQDDGVHTRAAGDHPAHRRRE